MLCIPRIRELTEFMVKFIRSEKARKFGAIFRMVLMLLGFPTGRDSATFRDSGTAKTFLSRDKGTTGQKFLYCPGTKGQRDKLKILPRDGTGRDSQNLGRDGPGQPKSGTGRGTKRDRAEKDVLKQYKDVLKQKRMF